MTVGFMREKVVVFGRVTLLQSSTYVSTDSHFHTGRQVTFFTFIESEVFSRFVWNTDFISTTY